MRGQKSTRVSLFILLSLVSSSQQTKLFKKRNVLKSPNNDTPKNTMKMVRFKEMKASMSKSTEISSECNTNLCKAKKIVASLEADHAPESILFAAKKALKKIVDKEKEVKVTLPYPIILNKLTNALLEVMSGKVEIGNHILPSKQNCQSVLCRAENLLKSLQKSDAPASIIDAGEKTFNSIKLALQKDEIRSKNILNYFLVEEKTRIAQMEKQMFARKAMIERLDTYTAHRSETNGIPYEELQAEVAQYYPDLYSNNILQTQSHVLKEQFENAHLLGAVGRIGNVQGNLRQLYELVKVDKHPTSIQSNSTMTSIRHPSTEVGKQIRNSTSKSPSVTSRVNSLVDSSNIKKLLLPEQLHSINSNDERFKTFKKEPLKKAMTDLTQNFDELRKSNVQNDAHGDKYKGMALQIMNNFKQKLANLYE